MLIHFLSARTFKAHCFTYPVRAFTKQVEQLGLLESPSTCHRIAQAGQNRYLESLSPAGGEAFAQHFAALIQKAVEKSDE